MSKKILVMPGTYWVKALCKRIKELGYSVLLVDPHPDCPCREYADEYLQSDIFDWDKVLAFARENKIDAVMSDECDIAMPMVSKLGEELGLTVQSSKVIKYFTDKFMMREFCKEHGLKYPEYRLCKTKEEAIEFFESLKRPIIIKPLDSNASHGVFKIDNISDIEDHFDETLKFSRIEKAVLAERYIVGREFTIDGIKTKTSHYTLAISKKDHYKHNPSIANELYFSYDDPEYDYDKLRAVNDKYIMVSGLEYGFTHAEYKLENGEYYLIEIAARGGGNMISSLITHYLSGYETYDFLINAALGNIEDYKFVISDDYKSRCAVMKFFDTPIGGGKVKAIEGIDYLNNCQAIKEYQLHFGVGDVIGDCLNDSARIGFYIACTEKREQLNMIIEEIKNQFSIIV
jgi:biotin carboxylase